MPRATDHPENDEDLSNNSESKDQKRQESWSYESDDKGLGTSAQITKDGRLLVKFHLKKDLHKLCHTRYFTTTVQEYAIDEETWKQAPSMNIVVMLVGSRGDIQPFLTLGQRLQRHGHRVRLATHEAFGEFVKSAGLEFYAIGGDPAELMSYMVKNPGLIPGVTSLKNGDITRKRKMLGDMLQGCWEACYKPDEETGKQFLANAIISNPPAFAHIHCAEALGIPLHLSFTMPWCATKAFPHPLVNVNQSNTEPGITNYLSYAMAELMQWQGLGDVINRFRMRTLRLEPLSHGAGPSATETLKIPYTYCFSPALIPKPEDWLNNIDVVGFYFYESSNDYEPPSDLMEFLKAGDPPVYIGFGSIVVEDPDGVTNTILDAVQLAGVRAVVSAGWGGLGAKNRNIPSSVFLLPDKPGVPHDWLFKHVSIVCHHGGAGTTAIGLFLGKPTIIVPFFGDQPFWGQMVYRTGAGPKPIHPNELSPQKLADGIRYCQTDKAKDAAEGMGAKIRSENGPEKGVESFYRHLPLLNMRCDLYPDRLAVWWSRQHYLKLSSFAAQILIDAGALNADMLERHRSKEYSIHRVATNPLIGGVLAPLWTVTESTSSLARVFTKPIDGVISTVFAVPRGLANFALSVQEGLQYAPTAFGVDVREPGEIRDWKSGMREGGRAFGHGLGDGISGFFTEPYHGMKEEGITGVFKGSGRGLINAQFKPMAGTAALFTHSTRGVWNSVKKRLNKGRDRSIGARDILLQQGREEFDDSTEAQRQLILQRFEKAKETYPARRKAVKQKLKLRRRPSVEPETSVARTAPAGVGTDAMETYVDCRPSEEWMEQNGVEDWTAEGNSSSESDSSSETFGSDDISNDPPSAAHHTMLSQQG